MYRCNGQFFPQSVFSPWKEWAGPFFQNTFTILIILHAWGSNYLRLEKRCGPGGGGGGGGTLIFSAYVGSDPASTVLSQKLSEI